MRKESEQSELVSIVIVNYNTKDILRECLSNLQNKYSPLQLIVVDNNSSDGSPQMVENNFPDVVLIPLEQNVGLAAGNNLGLETAKGKYVLFMGSDAFPEEGSIATLVEYMNRNDDVGISVGEVRLRSGVRDKDTHRGFPTPWVSLTHLSGIDKLFPKSRILGRYYMEYEDFGTVHEIDLCTSHFMFTRKSMFEDIGNFDEDFFVYGEDVDLCWRAKRSGWRIVYVPGAKVLHYKGVSVGIRKETQDITRATRADKERMLTETTHAMSKFYRKHYGEKGYNRLVIFGIDLLARIRAARQL